MSDDPTPHKEGYGRTIRGKVADKLTTEFPDLDANTISAVLDETDTVKHRDDAGAWLEAARKKLNEAA